MATVKGTAKVDKFTVNVSSVIVVTGKKSTNSVISKNGNNKIFGAAGKDTFNIKGGVKEAHAFIDHLQIFSLLANVADVKSLVIHPATTTHSQMTEEELAAAGIGPNTIRLSIGTEHIEDILDDLAQAFDAV